MVDGRADDLTLLQLCCYIDRDYAKSCQVAATQTVAPSELRRCYSAHATPMIMERGAETGKCSEERDVFKERDAVNKDFMHQPGGRQGDVGSWERNSANGCAPDIESLAEEEILKPFTRRYR